MSRFLFATFGSLGDLHPCLAVAKALAARGHTPVIASAEEYRTASVSVGAEFVPVPPSMAELGDHESLIKKLFDPRRGPEHLIRNVVMPYVRSSYECLLDASNGADLLVSHPLTFALPLVAQRLGLPWVSAVLAPMSLMSSFDPPLLGAAPWLRRLHSLGPTPYGLLFGLIKRVGWSWEAPVRKLRQELGLPPSKQMAMFEGQFSPLMTLALFDPQLAKPQPDWPVNTRICGTPRFDGQARNDADIDALERFLGEGDTPIVFALGSSAVWVAGDFWDKAAAAAQHLGRRAVLITGPVTPKALPAGVVAFPFLPYSKVFLRAVAVVHQAGIGTLAQAMRSGRPQLIVPFSFDQPDNARRAQLLGIGRVVPFQKITVHRLIAELDLLLSHVGYSDAASVLAKELATTDGAESAANELIACAHFRKV